MNDWIGELALRLCMKKHQAEEPPCATHIGQAKLRVYDQVLSTYRHFPPEEIDRRINLCPDCLQFDDYHESDCDNAMAGGSDE